MPKTQDLSLDEEAVFAPLTAASPEFLHSEGERRAVERLLSAGSEAFYAFTHTECSGSFLSPEEVGQISTWARDFGVSPAQRDEDEDGGCSPAWDCSSTYFPAHSDTPTPCLDLGWPERSSWLDRESVTVLTSPPAEGQPHIREVIRCHLQTASKVIAIVTDRLTDGAIIKDLHNAASRGVPVYIILNQRSIQGNFTLNRLKHPKLQVRLLGGKSFCSRKGRMVTGEMKDNFLLVDLDTVIHGSYSLTWTDAHLHRQLVTVLTGPVVESFDKEFRILFAASLAIPRTMRRVSVQWDGASAVKDFADLNLKNHTVPQLDSVSPPPLPSDRTLNWEAMGVTRGQPCVPEQPVNHLKETMATERLLANHFLLNPDVTVADKVETKRRNQTQDQGSYRLHETASPQTNNGRDRPPALNKTPLVTPDALTLPHIYSAQRRRRTENQTELLKSRQLSDLKSSKSEENNTPTTAAVRSTGDKQEKSDDLIFSGQRRERLKKESILGGSTENLADKAENTPSSRKPLILMVPRTETFSSLSDIMRRLQGQPSRPKATMAELSRSMIDLSAQRSDGERGSAQPRLQDNSPHSPALSPYAVLKMRNEELHKDVPLFLPSSRPRNSLGIHLDWRRQRKDKDEGVQ